MVEVEQASRTRTGTDKDAPIPELPGGWPATSSFARRRRRRRHQLGHSAYDSRSLLADDEESLDGSPNEANGELCHTLSCPTILSP